MSELLCCDRCGELSIYEKIIYIRDKPICPTCMSQAFDHLEMKSYEVLKKKFYLKKEKLTRKTK